MDPNMVNVKSFQAEFVLDYITMTKLEIPTE